MCNALKIKQEGLLTSVRTGILLDSLMRYLLLFSLRKLTHSFVLLAPLAGLYAQVTNVNLRVMSANLNGNQQSYQPFALRIFQGVKPDVVAIQEFNYTSTNGLGINTPAAFREMLDAAFGTNFTYMRETGSYNIPNGVISRYPIIASGQWEDSLVNDRGFAWAQIDLPGSNDLYVVSIHLYSSGTAADRNAEAMTIKTQIQNNFPAEAWVVVAGDFNTSSRSEAAISTFSTFLSDSPIPTDAEAGGDADTNDPRNKPYDYVLPSFSMTNALTNVVFASHSFSNGLVFDSRVYSPLSDVSPVLVGDSSNAQHMAVLKDFTVGEAVSNSSSGPFITAQPQSQTVPPGSNAIFTVFATGAAPLSFQWRFNGTNISGATVTSCTRTNAQAADAGGYSVVVTNSAGSVTSSVATLTINSSQSSSVIAQWNFNSPASDTNTTTGTLTSSTGTGSASYIGGTAAASSGEFASGSASDTNATDNSGWNTSFYPAAGANNKSAGVKFTVSTAGRQNISIRWDQRASGTGSKYSHLQYTTNGTAFVDYPTPIILSGTSFEAKTNDLSALAGVNNNPNFAFRIVAEFESSAITNANAQYVGASSTYGTGGTLRFDMVTITGTAMPASGPPAPAVLGEASVAANQFRFTVSGSAGSNYIVQAATNLASPIWTSLATNAAPFTFTNSISAFPARFYRAIVP